MSNTRPPGDRSPGKDGYRAGDVREAGQRLSSSHSQFGSPEQASPALWSEALCAAGKCIAAVRAGFTPTKIELFLSRDALLGWGHWIDGFDASRGGTVGREIMMAGTSARHLSDSDEPDVVAVMENTALIAALKLKTQTDTEWFMKLNIAAGKLVLRHEAVIRAIAGRLVVAKSMSGEELAAHLAPVLRRKR